MQIVCNFHYYFQGNFCKNVHPYLKEFGKEFNKKEMFLIKEKWNISLYVNEILFKGIEAVIFSIVHNSRFC